MLLFSLWKRSEFEVGSFFLSAAQGPADPVLFSRSPSGQGMFHPCAYFRASFVWGEYLWHTEARAHLNTAALALPAGVEYFFQWKHLAPTCACAPGFRLVRGKKSWICAKGKVCVWDHREQHNLGWFLVQGRRLYQNRTLSSIVLWLFSILAWENAVRPRGGFVALSIFDLGNLRNTCLEAEPEVMILACPCH